MEIGILSAIAVLLIVGTSIAAGRIGVAAPLLLVLLGIGLGFLPFVPLIEIDPEIILIGVLPPLLYSAAVNVPLVDFRRNFRPVIGLSVLLVIISAVVVGVVVHLLVPAIPLALGIALGAVISPTDAVAATSIGKRLGMPSRLVSILEGESLVNDATSLVLLKTALAAIAGSFVFWDAAGSFAYAVAVAIAIGFVIGLLTVWVRSRLRNPIYDTVVSFIVPFIAFIPAEELGASGVLAVVVTGLYTGHHSATRFSASARINERLNWRTLQFIIENGVFLIMGLQLHALVEEVGESPFELSHLGLISLLLVGVLILCRAVFMVPLLLSMRGTARRYEARNRGFARLADRVDAVEARDERQQRRIRRFQLRRKQSEADLAHEQEQQLGWRDGTVLSWSGMRGVVTLAAAQSISVDVPFRAQIVLLAFAVAVATLLLHGLTLPPLIRRLWPQSSGSREAARSHELAALSRDLIDEGTAALDDALAADDAQGRGDGAEDGERPHAAPSPEVVARVRAGARNALAPIALALPETGLIETQASETPAQQYLRLSRLVLDAQRTALLEERAIGRYSSSALHTAELALDAYESRLAPPEVH